MTWKQKIIEGGFPVWVKDEGGSFLSEAVGSISEAFASRMGNVVERKPLRLNLGATVNCRKTKRLAKKKWLEENKPEPTYEEMFGEDEEPVLKTKPSIARTVPNGIGKRVKKPGMWK
jgi:hypothetical protein